MRIDETVLRDWVRDRLSDVERREVNLWMLRNPDPGLPDLMHALSVEWSDQRRDARVQARDPVSAALVDAWSWLVGLGQARWDPLVPQLVLNAVGDEVAEVAPLALREGDDPSTVAVDVRLEDSAWVTIFVTDDGGGSARLLAPAELDRGEHRDLVSWSASQEQGRVTIWLFTGDVAPPDAMEDCLPLARTGALLARAARWQVEPGG